MEERILNILRVTFENENLDMTCSQSNCDKWDSLNHLNLIVELEAEFEMDFEPEEIAQMKNFDMIKQIVAQKL